ncbi:hypothetical protein M434DRAFT_34240 [Hypoxylon sp. CO27-5]|nr:hypothetical protein M434DRAFT_34240 [Hypoxylon sp. CO27-5]
MSAYAVTTAALFGVAPHINFPVFGSNDSSVIGSVAPTSTLNTSTANLFQSSIANAADPTSSSITTHVVVDIVQSSDVIAAELVDSVPEVITIDTVLSSIRPQAITQVEPEPTTEAPVAGRRSDASYPTTGTYIG